MAITEFQLPEMNQYVEVMDVCIRSDPSPSVNSSTDVTFDGVNPPVAFMTAAENRLFTITYHVATVPDDTGDHRALQAQSLVLFVPLRTFLPHISRQRAAESTGQGGEIIRSSIIQTDTGIFLDDRDMQADARARQQCEGGIAVPWEDWMQKGSRALLVPTAERVWVCNVFGSRYVHGVEPRDFDAPRMARHVAILDFNVDALWREKARAAMASDADETAEDEEVDVNTEEKGRRATLEIRDDPTTLEASSCGIFEEDVTTSLPYRRTVLREKMKFDGVMLTEDNIIFVNVSRTPTCFCMVIYPLITSPSSIRRLKSMRF